MQRLWARRTLTSWLHHLWPGRAHPCPSSLWCWDSGFHHPQVGYRLRWHHRWSHRNSHWSFHPSHWLLLLLWMCKCHLNRHKDFKAITGEDMANSPWQVLKVASGCPLEDFLACCKGCVSLQSTCFHGTGLRVFCQGLMHTCYHINGLDKISGTDFWAFRVQHDGQTITVQCIVFSY